MGEVVNSVLREGERMTYDERQTALCNRMRERLQSIAILAVQGQDEDPSGDPLADILALIGDDLAVAVETNNKLQANDF